MCDLVSHDSQYDSQCFLRGDECQLGLSQSVRKLREADRMLSEGKAVSEVARELGVSARTPIAAGGTSTAA